METRDGDFLDAGGGDLELFVEVVVDPLLCLEFLMSDFWVHVHLMPEFNELLQLE